jgi:hypothetical protein
MSSFPSTKRHLRQKDAQRKRAARSNNAAAALLQKKQQEEQRMRQYNSEPHQWLEGQIDVSRRLIQKDERLQQGMLRHLSDRWVVHTQGGGLQMS